MDRDKQENILIHSQHYPAPAKNLSPDFWILNLPNNYHAFSLKQSFLQVQEIFKLNLKVSSVQSIQKSSKFDCLKNVPNFVSHNLFLHYFGCKDGMTSFFIYMENAIPRNFIMSESIFLSYHFLTERIKIILTRFFFIFSFFLPAFPKLVFQPFMSFTIGAWQPSGLDY